MSTTVEIDKAGRIVVPKKLRDELHLTPGTRLTVQRSGDALHFELDLPVPRMIMIEGLWVLADGSRLTNEDVNSAIDEQRERRMRYVSGLSNEP